MLPKNYKDAIQDKFVEVAWMQWRRMGIFASGDVCQYSVDIENFLLFSALACRSDNRLFENVVIWFHYYHGIIQKERLSNLLKSLNNHFVTRFVGALADCVSGSTWKNFVQNCKKMSSSGTPDRVWAPKIPVPQGLIHPVFQKWGLEFPNVPPEKITSKKMLDHGVVVKKNAVFSYRYCFEPTTRADIWYLLSISMNLKKRVEWDHITCLRLASCLGVHDTTIYRIQKDFEKAGLLYFPETEEHKRLMWTWKVPTSQFPFVSRPLELGLLHWTDFVLLMCELWIIICNIENISNEIIAKSKLIDVQKKWDDWLIRHELESCDLQFDGVPLSEKSLHSIADSLLRSLGSFTKILSGLRRRRR